LKHKAIPFEKLGSMIVQKNICFFIEKKRKWIGAGSFSQSKPGKEVRRSTLTNPSSLKKEDVCS
jgi:hypothetical protein